MEEQQKEDSLSVCPRPFAAVGELYPPPKPNATRATEEKAHPIANRIIAFDSDVVSMAMRWLQSFVVSILIEKNDSALNEWR